MVCVPVHFQRERDGTRKYFLFNFGQGVSRDKRLLASLTSAPSAPPIIYLNLFLQVFLCLPGVAFVALDTNKQQQHLPLPPSRLPLRMLGENNTRPLHQHASSSSQIISFFACRLSSMARHPPASSRDHPHQSSGQARGSGYSSQQFVYLRLPSSFHVCGQPV